MSRKSHPGGADLLPRLLAGFTLGKSINTIYVNKPKDKKSC